MNCQSVTVSQRRLLSGAGYCGPTAV